MKDNLDYYPHFADSHSSPKFFALRIKYDWAGEGMFWALNNLIARASNCELDVSDTMRKAPIADLFKMDFEQLEAFFVYLRDECQLIDYNDGIITTERVTETYEKIESDRQKARRRKSSKTPSSGGKGKSSGEPDESSGEPSKRVKERKGKEKRGKEREGAAEPDSSESFANSETAHEIEQYIRVKMRKALSQMLDGTEYDVPTLAAEIGRTAAGDNFQFNPKNAGSRKGLETYATRYTEKLPRKSSDVTDGGFTDKATIVFDLYHKHNRRIVPESTRQSLRGLVREHIVKPGYTEADLVTAFRAIADSGPAFEDLAYTVKNIDTLLRIAANRQAA